MIFTRQMIMNGQPGIGENFVQVIEIFQINKKKKNTRRAAFLEMLN